MTWQKSLKIDRATGIIIKDDRVLLFHRFRDEKEYWVFPGGGIETGESPEEALDREMNEELTLKIKQKKFIFKIFNLERWEHHFLINQYEGIPELSGPELNLHNENNQFIVTWVSMKELKKLENFYPNEGRDILLEMYNKNEL